MPVIVGSEDERGIDISNLRKQTGCITLDEGFVNTGSTTSAITFLDGEKGVLRYRGYPIEQIAKHCDFVETSFLLIYGRLPNEQEFSTFRESIRRHTMIHEDMRSFYNGFPKDAHPMAILSSVVGALSTFYQDSLDPHDARQVEVSIHRLLAKLPTIAAYSYKKSIGQPFMYPQNDLSYCENFLRMMFAVPTFDYEPDPVFVEALNMLLDLPRRSRAELQYLNRTHGRLFQCQFVCVDISRNLCSVGTIAWRCQRSMRQHAAANHRGRRQCQEICGKGQGQIG